MKKVVIAIIFIMVSLWMLQPVVASAREYFGNVDVHGFISQGYLDATDDMDYLARGVGKGTFEFNEMGINFSTGVTDVLRIGVQLIAYDIGDLGNDELILDWATADYRWQNWMGIRAGIIKIPYGFYNETRDIDFLRTPIFLSISLYGELFRDAFTRMKGISLYGSLPYGLSYQYIYGITPFKSDGGLIKSLGTMFFFEALETEVSGSQSFSIQWDSPIEGVRFGSSIYWVDDFKIDGVMSDRTFLEGTPLTTEFDQMLVACGSVEYTLGDLILSAEYTQNLLKINYKIPLLSMDRDYDIDMEGYYGALTYRFSELFVAGLMYSEIYLNKNSKSGRWGVDNMVTPTREKGYLKDLTLSFRFDINYNWLLKLELHGLKGEFMTLNDPTYDNDIWFLYAAKMSYFF